MVRELNVAALPRREKHPTIFRMLDDLEVGDVLRIVNDHDPLPLRHALDRSAPGAFGFDYLEAGPDVWRVEIRKIGEGATPRLGIESGPIVL